MRRLKRCHVSSRSSRPCEVLRHCDLILALWCQSTGLHERFDWSGRSMTGIDKIAAAEDRLDQGLPVELAAPGFHRGHQSLISLPGGDRCHFLFRPVLDLLVHIAAIVNRSLGSLAHHLCIRYHLESPRSNDSIIALLGLFVIVENYACIVLLL